MEQSERNQYLLKTAYQKTDLHTHTCASGHGTSDRIVDLAREAARRRMETLGISDHGPASSGSAGLSYFRGLSLCERKRFGVRVLYGVEANILDAEGHLDLPDDVLATLDYCIVSMHRPVYAPGSPAENTRAYIRAMKHPGVRMIGHCDDSRFPVDYPELVRACAALGVLPELNNVSLLPDSYRKDGPANARRLLSACETLSCPILLSSDSHGKEHIGEVTEARKLIAETGFPRELVAEGPGLF
ncbi:MAG: PHP domain-containing protein [Roseburia sp.]|nr:PHP domain-containing protein [Roseburia sp.]MCM1099477.1 PHP domain-containing protein [Ruminococcus flavefaciens]